MTLRAGRLALWKALTSVIGPDEIMLVAAILMVTVGLWPIAEKYIGVGRAALLVPGLVCLWVAIPSRSAFIKKADDATRGLAGKKSHQYEERN